MSRVADRTLRARRASLLCDAGVQRPGRHPAGDHARRSQRGDRGLRRRGDGRRRHRRRRLPQARRRGARTCSSRATSDGHWLAPIRVDSEEPFAPAGRGSAPPNDGELIVVWATPFATRNGKPVYELLGSELGPGGRKLRAGDPDRSQHRRSDRHQPRPRGQLQWPGRRGLPGRRTAATDIALLRPGDVVEQVRVAHFDGQRWSNLGAINRNPVVLDAPAHRSQCARDRDRPDRQRRRRLAGARRRRRRADLGAATVRQLSGLRDAGQRDHATTARRSSTDADAPQRRLLPPGTGRGRPTASRAAPARRFPGRGSSSTSCRTANRPSGAEFARRQRRRRTVAGGRRAVVGPPSIDIDEQQGMRLLYDANGTPRVIEGDGQRHSSPASRWVRRSRAPNRLPSA